MYNLFELTCETNKTYIRVSYKLVNQFQRCNYITTSENTPIGNLAMSFLIPLQIYMHRKVKNVLKSLEHNFHIHSS